ncbi:MAG: hypothetical protein JWM99_129, partial [Verrucomicrobiales bacterium]|nr:hypothetical protein [Verrucomicrobiales bacterium]
LIYLSLWAIITGVAFSAFYRALANSRNLHRNAEDITRVLHAGEIWRADVREATGPLQSEMIEAQTALQIPHGSNAILYLFTGTNVLRASDTNHSWVEMLARVTVSAMTNDMRTQVSVWRWDLELVSPLRNPKIRPIFSFEAVPKFQEKR